MIKKVLFQSIALSFVFVSAASAESEYVTVSGMSVGMRIYTDGLSVAAVQEITDINGNQAAPAYDAGIRFGDVILSASGSALNCVEDLSRVINSTQDEVTLEIKRNNEPLSITVTPVKTDNENYKIGLWVRDSAAGIGTITYFNPKNNTFAALGHAICDVDTGNILSVNWGNIQQCSHICATKSEKGKPGELNGVFDGKKIGEITLNSSFGIYGVTNDDFTFGAQTIETAQSNEVVVGKAYILSDVLGNGVERFDIEITKVKNKNSGTKSLTLRVTDKRLVDATGGIVRGMSGAPIIQNDKLVGAVTHVCVNL